jgi:hypothetical protein
MNIDPKTINVAGPTSFPGGYILRRNLCNLGFTSCLADAETPIPPEKVEQTIALIQESIDRGVPAIVFDLFIPEFGLIYGYDDELQVFHAKDVSKDGTLTYTQFADPKIGLLFVTTISESLPHSKYEMLRMALDMILDHARGREWTHVFKDQFVIGLAGYDTWISVMERLDADEYGNAYNTAVITDAREYAAQFLRDLASRWDGTNVIERMVRKQTGEAAKHYTVVTEAFRQLRDLFPFPQGGNPKDAETKGIEVLGQLLDFMKAYHSEKWIH